MVREEWKPGIYKRDDQHPWLVPVKMPFTKIDGFLQEFSFRQFIGWEAPVSQVYVFRAEPNLITRPLLHIERDEGGIRKLNERVYLLNEHRNLVTATGTEMVWSRRFPYFWKKVCQWRMVQSIGIVASGSIKDELSILGKKSQFVRIIYSYSPYTEAAIVYKIPKDVSVCEWLRSETETAKADFKNKFDKI
jgi:hypothetical protein